MGELNKQVQDQVCQVVQQAGLQARFQTNTYSVHDLYDWPIFDYTPQEEPQSQSGQHSNTTISSYYLQKSCAETAICDATKVANTKKYLPSGLVQNVFTISDNLWYPYHPSRDG